MSKSISVTVPLERSAIDRAIDFLHGIGVDLKNEAGPVEPAAAVAMAVPASVQIVDPLNVDPLGTEPADPIVTVGVEPAYPVDTVGVELDSAGLPHDSRIHGAKRLKTTKDGTWKKIRGVDAGLVATVEAELRAAMDATPDVPIVPAAPTPEPVALEIRYLVEGAAFTAEQLKKSGWSDSQISTCETVPVEEPAVTFPDLMKRITAAVTAGDIDDAAVTVALNAQGLASLPLLAARPDLIPAVFDTLFA